MFKWLDGFGNTIDWVVCRVLVDWVVCRVSVEIRVRLVRRETGLSPTVKYFYWPFQSSASSVDHLGYFCLVFVMLSCTPFFLMPCGHLLGKGWPLGSRLWCIIVKLSLSHWYPGSGLVLVCIDSWSLPSFFLMYQWTVASVGLQRTDSPTVSVYERFCQLEQTLYYWHCGKMK